MKDSMKPALDVYMKRIYEAMIILVPVIALVAGATFTVIKLVGYYETVSLTTLLIFDASCVVYFLCGLAVRLKCEDERGNLRPYAVKHGKIFIALVVLIQWNFISYMIPSADFWAYSIYFVLCSVFFLDSSLVLVCELEVAASLALSWVIRPDVLLPARDAYFAPNIALRTVLILLSFGALYLLSYFIEKLLVAELEVTSEYDMLTMLRSRKYLKTVLEASVEKAEAGENLSVLICDLDDFTFINKNYGFDSGDVVMKTIADEVFVASGVRGRTYRYESDRTVVVTDIVGEELKEYAENLRRAVEAKTVKANGKLINVTMTIGCAEYKKGDTADMLIERAKEKLVIGKHSGKNTTVV